MTTLELGPVGVTLDVEGRPGHLADAAELERLGYSTIWIAGGQLGKLSPLADVLDATSTVGVGSAIIPANVHGPAAVAAFHAEQAAAHPGRFVAGLGAQGAKPVQALTAYLDELAAADPPVPASDLLVAALGPRKLALARDRTAGAITLLVTPEFTAHARAVLGPDARLVVMHYVALETDAEAARAAGRASLRFLTRVPGYHANLLKLGFSETDVDELTDALVDATVAWGGADAVAGRLREHLDAGADQVVPSVLSTVEGDDPHEAWRQLADRLVVR